MTAALKKYISQPFIMLCQNQTQKAVTVSVRIQSLRDDGIVSVSHEPSGRRLFLM